ncbi:MAG: hypothetical protein HQL74_07360, partial [Magnetococcales bacterium]|nr:hypothetical protein [Magnetococcales bacterium]
MKSFLHLSSSSTDPFICGIEAEFGLEGYARWFKLLEVVSGNSPEGKGSSVAYSWPQWQSFLKGKRNKLETFLVHLENKGAIKRKQTGNILEIEVFGLRGEVYNKETTTNKDVVVFSLNKKTTTEDV